MPKITLEGLDFTYTTSISKLLKRNLLAKKVQVASSRVIYQGIPVEKFPLKEHAGSLHSPIRVLYAGQLHHYKGVHTIFKAMGRLVGDASMPSLHLTVAGKGPEEYTRELARLSEELNVATSFIGAVAHEKMSALYQEHDIFVFPSIWEEPFGLTHLEAMASGLPVISTANGGQGEFLVDGRNSLIFKAEDENALKDALKIVITDEGLRKALIHEGRRVVEQSFAFERYVDELEALLREASH
ncbi:MAG: glycosyltransferase family 1 protein [Spirochaetia bacterium]|nr:glycosyltransferase family 1 protein [Spirochaetia bacterium]